MRPLSEALTAHVQSLLTAALEIVEHAKPVKDSTNSHKSSGKDLYNARKSWEKLKKLGKSSSAKAGGGKASAAKAGGGKASATKAGGGKASAAKAGGGKASAAMAAQKKGARKRAARQRRGKKNAQKNAEMKAVLKNQAREKAARKKASQDTPFTKTAVPEKVAALDADKLRESMVETLVWQDQVKMARGGSVEICQTLGQVLSKGDGLLTENPLITVLLSALTQLIEQEKVATMNAVARLVLLRRTAEKYPALYEEALGPRALDWHFRMPHGLPLLGRMRPVPGESHPRQDAVMSADFISLINWSISFDEAKRALAKSGREQQENAAAGNEDQWRKFLETFPAESDGQLRKVLEKLVAGSKDPWVELAEKLSGGEDLLSELLENATAVTADQLPKDSVGLHPVIDDVGGPASIDLNSMSAETRVQDGTELLTGMTKDPEHILKAIAKAVAAMQEELRSEDRTDDALGVNEPGKTSLGGTQMGKAIREKEALQNAALAKEDQDRVASQAERVKLKQDRQFERRAKRKLGGQPGSVGKTHGLVDMPDEIVYVEFPDKGLYEGNPEWRELPPKRCQIQKIVRLVWNTEYRKRRFENVRTDEIVVAKAPPEANAPFKYDVSVKVSAILHRGVQLLPFERMKKTMHDMHGFNISTGTLCNFLKEAYNSKVLEDFDRGVCHILTKSKCGCFDESGGNVRGDLVYYHVAVNEMATRIFLHPKRGKEAMDAGGILNNFKNIAVTDCLASYWLYDFVHAICGAHILRELLASAQCGYEWAVNMSALLVSLVKKVNDNGGVLSPRMQNNARKKYKDIIPRLMPRPGPGRRLRSLTSTVRQP
jgi:hypothetical protein